MHSDRRASSRAPWPRCASSRCGGSPRRLRSSTRRGSPPWARPSPSRCGAPFSSPSRTHRRRLTCSTGLRRSRRVCRGRRCTPSTSPPDAPRSCPPGHSLTGLTGSGVVAEEAGATYHAVIGDDIAASVRDVATAVHAHTVVVGARQPARLDRSPLSWVWRPPGVAARLARGDRPRPPRRPSAGPGAAASGDQPASALCAAAGPGLRARRRAAAAAHRRSSPGRGSGRAGRRRAAHAGRRGGHDARRWSRPGVARGPVASTLLNWYFIPPVHTLQISEPHNIVTLVGFAAVALLVSAVVHRAASLSAEAARAATESRALSAIARARCAAARRSPLWSSSCGRPSAWSRSACCGVGRRAMRPGRGTGRWSMPQARSRRSAPRTPRCRCPQAPTSSSLSPVAPWPPRTGPSCAPSPRRPKNSWSATGSRTAAVADRLAATERLRDALLAAVGHDLRTPSPRPGRPSTACAARMSTGPRPSAGAARRRRESLTRLASLVADLLDLSRLRAGVLTVARDSVWLDDLVPPALDELGLSSDAVTLARAAGAPAGGGRPRPGHPRRGQPRR
ncbi:MAG: DUF4118 domain-containing protein [Actinomycetales bacterium]|nr:DUF4118 domain-containing protein [Candidatus Lutibacillus vidarii]